MIKAVIFDFFGVLVSTDLNSFYDDYCANEGVKQQAKAIIREFNSGFSKLRYNDVITRLSKLARVPEAEVGDYLEGNRPNRKLLDFIKNNLSGTYKISILSNAGEDWINELLDKNDTELFDDIVLSYQHGVTKPSREIYLLAAKRLGFEPKECVFIDDTQRHCLAAEEAGMKAINYKNFDQMKTELRNF